MNKNKLKKSSPPAGADLRRMVVNAFNDRASALVRERMFGVGGSIDCKRSNAYAEYGFPSDIDDQMFYHLYRRGGVAHGAVNKLAGKCWETHPWIIEGEDHEDSKPTTAFDLEAKRVLRPEIWRAFYEADRMRLAGRFSALILQYGDSKSGDVKDLKNPVTGKANRLVSVMPVWGSAMKVLKSDGLGRATLWQYTGSNGKGVEIHADRVIILGDYSPGGIAFLEAAYNNGVTLEKVEGGSGESFLKNAARQLGINFDKEISVDDIARSVGRPAAEIQDVFDDVVRGMNRGDDSALVTIGADVSAITANIPDPRPSYEINIQSFCAAVDIPSRILIGNQQGERASTEDLKQFNARGQSRRVNENAYEIRDFVYRLISHGALPFVASFSVMWDDLTTPTKTDQLANAKTMSEINTANLATGQPVFTTEEIRIAAGFENDEAPAPLPEIEDDGE